MSRNPRKSRHMLDVHQLHKYVDRCRVDRQMTWKDISEATGLTSSAMTRLSYGRPVSADTLVTLLTWAGVTDLQGFTVAREAGRG